MSYEGRHFQLAGAQCDPKPVQSPRPQVLIGGGGEQLTLRVVARLADESNFGGKPHEFAHKCDVLRRHCANIGRDYDEIQKTWSPEIFIRESDQEIIDGGSRSFYGEAYESWRAGNLVGTPEQVVDEGAVLHRPRLHRLLPLVLGLSRNRDDAPVRRTRDPAPPGGEQLTAPRCIR